MPTPFDALTVKNVLALLTTATPAWMNVNARFYDGDHWQNSDAWIGPRPKTSEPGATDVLNEIARQFVSTNVIREVVNRHRDGVVSREPRWGLTVARALRDNEQATRGEQAMIDEAEAALTTWWDERSIHATLQAAVTQALQTGRCVVRVYLPPAYVSEQGVVEQVPDLVAALDRLWLDIPASLEAIHERDRRSMQRVGIYAYQEAQQARAELTFVDGDATVVQIIGEDEGDARVREEMRLPLGGRLISYELQVSGLVTEQVRQLQKALNASLTMMEHNVMLAGFVERVITNAEMPYDLVDDPANPSKQKKVYRPHQVGMGKTTSLVGLPIRDEKGKITGYTNPSIDWRQPVDVSTFINTDDALYRRILKEVKQLHALMSDDAAASGESRKQAITDFVASLTNTASAVNGLVRWLLETVLALAAHLCGRTGQFEILRSVVSAWLYVGPLSSEDRKAIIEMYKEGLISRETAMSLLEVEDVDAELARLNAEEESKQARQTRTLAAALVQQRVRVDSGIASTGLEQL